MVQTIAKHRKIHMDKVCRTCLTERGHLREIFSTRLPTMMENCASVQVTEKDDLPRHVCVSCFHQIAKFYNFKKKMERNDKILRNYIKQNKAKTGAAEFSDILHKAVNNADITASNQVLKVGETEPLPVEKCPLITNELGIEAQLKRSPRLARKSKQKANKMIDEIIKEETKASEQNTQLINNSKILADYLEGEVESEMNDVSKLDVLEPNFFNLPASPPPLIPLLPAKVVPNDDFGSTSSLSTLPENTPPLVPILPPVSTIDDPVLGLCDFPMDLNVHCNTCNEVFSSVLALKQHRLFSCQQTGLLQCNICRKEFKDRKRLIGHLKGHMVSKDYGCKICGKRYPNPSTFRVHMRTHTGERPFHCSVCNKGFVRWAGVVGHMKTHNATKPYTCDTCGKGFKISSNLERHKVLHSGSLPFCCSYCGKTFSQADNLRLHIRTYHTNERPYLCNECGKGFVSSTRLNRHMWVHSGFKPYKCAHCPKAYSNSNDRKNHERTHTGESDQDKPHMCTMCDMRFLHPCRLAKHMKTHERPFQCPECIKTFSTEAVLNKHISSKHGDGFVDLSMPLSVEEVYIQYE